MTDIWREMLSGRPYDAMHPELIRRLEATREFIHRFNGMAPGDNAARESLLRELLGSCGKKIHINAPFRCDYGENIRVGENFFANFNLTILDEALVTIGDNAFIGPNVSIFTACHPLEAEARNRMIEWAEAVSIGDNVWIGGNAVILPGVTLGHNVVVGAGAVVTKSFPDNCLIAGNPARIIRIIENGVSKAHPTDASEPSTDEQRASSDPHSA